MAKIQLKRGLAANLPAIVDGQLLFTTDEGKIYLDNGTTRIELYKGFEISINDLKALVGNTAIATQIATEIAKLKKELVAEAENTNTVTLTIANNADSSAKKIKADVKLSSKADNLLEVRTADGEEGLYVAPAAAAPEYSIKKEASAEEGYSATYHLTKDNVNVGVAINIPKDMVVQSGSVVEDPADQPAGTYIELTLANATNDKLYINVGDLIEYVTSGSSTGDMIIVAVSDDHKVTATITDGTITKAKLHTDVQTSLGKADTALQAADITEGTTNGTIAVDGTDVNVHGLGNMAYEDKINFSFTDTAESGKYISSVSQVNGVITVTRAELPSLEWGTF